MKKNIHTLYQCLRLWKCNVQIGLSLYPTCQSHRIILPKQNLTPPVGFLHSPWLYVSLDKQFSCQLFSKCLAHFTNYGFLFPQNVENSFPFSILGTAQLNWSQIPEGFLAKFHCLLSAHCLPFSWFTSSSWNAFKIFYLFLLVYLKAERERERDLSSAGLFPNAHNNQAKASPSRSPTRFTGPKNLSHHLLPSKVCIGRRLDWKWRNQN